MPFGEPGIQIITLWLTCAAAVLSFASVVLGLRCTVRAKDPLPRRIRNLMRRVPASAEDFRLRGISLMLNGAAVMLLVSLFATDVVDRLTLGAIVATRPPLPSRFRPTPSSWSPR